jgi:uncharacterized protein YndB with AHSA1/START domain
MAEIRGGGSEYIAAPADKVFAYRLDFTNLPDYNPNVSNLRRIDGGTQPGPGAEYWFNITLPGFDAPLTCPIKVLEADPPNRIVFDTGMVSENEPNYFTREVCKFESEGEGTRAWFEMTLTIPDDLDEPTRTIYESNTQQQARLELDQIKKALES